MMIFLDKKKPFTFRRLENTNPMWKIVLKIPSIRGFVEGQESNPKENLTKPLLKLLGVANIYFVSCMNILQIKYY